MTRIAVTQPEYEKADAVFHAAARDGYECVGVASGEMELAEAVREHGVQHVIVGVERYAGPLYDALPAGGVVARFGVGHDGIDKDLATKKGLLCTNTPGVLDDSVAELTIALILAAARHVPLQAAASRRGEWSPMIGGELRDKTLAIIGCGSIGRRVARIAASGLRMKVVGCEIADVDAERMKRDSGFSTVVKDFSRAVAEADYVSLHVPSTPATRHFINRERLALLPDRARLINTARGAVVDEAALFDAVSRGRLAGAALDVFENEPYQPVAADADLRTLDNVVLTPHTGSSTAEACQRMALRALQNIRLAGAGRFDEMDLLNRPVCDRLR